MGEFEEYIMEYIPREQNSWADQLSKLTNTIIMASNKSVVQEVIEEPSISGANPLVYASWNKSKVSNNPS